MKKWFNNLPVWKKYFLHFILSFCIFLSLFILIERLWPDEKQKAWKDYLAIAFSASFLFEFFFNWILTLPDYFKKK